jgi:hypothetical protein
MALRNKNWRFATKNLRSENAHPLYPDCRGLHAPVWYITNFWPAPKRRARKSGAAMRRALSIICFLWAAPALAADAESSAVRKLLAEAYDKPGAPLTVEPVVIEGDAAIADWAQGDLAGRAYLKRGAGGWRIALCAGDALKDAAALEKLGMSRQGAQLLATQLSVAEKKLDPEYLKRMSRFDGMIAVDEAHGGAPADPHHMAPQSSAPSAAGGQARP